MKKLCFLSVFIALFCFSIYSDTGEQEEVDFLLFLPDSDDEFVNAEQAEKQLDNLAVYLKGRNLVPGQILVYGYAADYVNAYDPMVISRDRALFVINALVRRGVSRDLFSDPVAYGGVSLWGNNVNDEDRRPNRRVRILLDGSFLTPATIQPTEPEVQISGIDEEEADCGTSPSEALAKTEKTSSKFPWILLPLLLALLALLLLFRKVKKEKKTATPKKPVIAPTPAPAPKPAAPPAPAAIVVPPPAAAPKPAAPPAPAPAPAAIVVPTPAVAPAPAAAPPAPTVTVVNLDEEILFCAYMLFLQRNGQSENAEEDWHKAVAIICTKYEADGYQTYMEDWRWWAKRMSNEQ